MEELRILDHKVYNVKDKVYFIMNSVDDPTGFLLCYGEIEHKDSKNLNIVYLIKLLKIMNPKDEIIKMFHMKRLSVFHESSKTFRKIAFNIIDIVDDIDFSEKLQKKMSKYLVQTSSFFVSMYLDKAEDIQKKVNELSKNYLESMLKKFEI